MGLIVLDLSTSTGTGSRTPTTYCTTGSMYSTGYTVHVMAVGADATRMSQVLSLGPIVKIMSQSSGMGYFSVLLQLPYQYTLVLRYHSCDVQ